MTSTEWYRQTEWTQSASAEFEKRLSRARGQRGEYLRIQALTLADTRNPEVAEAAIGLAHRYLTLKKAGVGVAQTHATIAKSYATLGDIDSAISSYRTAVEAEHSQPNVRGYHYIEFAWYVATNSLTEQYDEVLAAMKHNMLDQDLMFPVNQYRYFGALAIISADLGDQENARRMAKNALAAAARKQGPFEGHAHLGLIEKGNNEALARLEHLSAA